MSDDRSLIRGLGRLEATNLVVGGIIGTSIFLITGDIASIVGSPALVLLTWLTAGMLAGAAALCFAELSAAIPETGGTYVFLKRAYRNELVAFSFAWMMCFAYGTGAIAVVAIMAAIFLVPVLEVAGIPAGEQTGSIAVVLIAILTALNVRGIRQSGMTQNVITILKLTLIAAMMSAPLIIGEPDIARLLAPGADETLRSRAVNVGTALMICLFSYNGAYFVTHVAGEIRKPRLNIPKAIVGGFLIVLSVYLVINLVYVTVMPFEAIRSSERIAADLMGSVFGAAGAIVTSVVVFISAIGVLNAQLLNYPRIQFALAGDGLFFRRIAVVHPATRTPAAAILLIGLFSALFALSGSYVQILSYVAFVIHFFICLAVIAVFILRVREPDLDRPYRVWGYPFTPAAFLLVSVFYLGNLVITQPLNVAVGVAIVLSGLPFYRYWRKLPDRVPGDV